MLHVISQSGDIEVTPMEARNIRGVGSTSKFCVKIQYGASMEKSTAYVPNAAELKWYQEVSSSSVDADHTTQIKEDNEKLKMLFPVNTYELKGPLCVSVISRSRMRKREVTRVELNIFNLLDCLLDEDRRSYYEKPRWFPLFLFSELVPAEFDEMSRFMKPQKAEQIDPSLFGHNRPCIRLRLRWIPHEDNNVIIPPLCSLYARLQLPSLSVAVIDTINAREVLQITLNGVEARRAVNEKYIDNSLNVMSFQVDNQLPEATASVMLSPTPQKHPQPITRLHVRRNISKSAQGLDSFDFVELVVQDLDLRLEQVTVLACSELMRYFYDALKKGDTTGNKDESLLYMIAGGSFSGGGSRGTYNGSKVDNYKPYEDLRSESSAEILKSHSELNMQDKQLFTSKSIAAQTILESEDSNKQYVRSFQIYPIKVNVTFIISPQKSNQRKWTSQIYVMKESANTTGQQSFMSAITMFTRQIGEVVLDLSASIADAPIVIAAINIEHLFKTNTELTKFLYQHYLTSILWQLYKIVG